MLIPLKVIGVGILYSIGIDYWSNHNRYVENSIYRN